MLIFACVKRYNDRLRAGQPMQNAIFPAIQNLCLAPKAENDPRKIAAIIKGKRHSISLDKARLDDLQASHSGTYSIVLADPNCEFSNQGVAGAAEDHYETAALDRICNAKLSDARPISELARRKAVLFLWVPLPLLIPNAEAVLKAWGFTYRTMLIWKKPKDPKQAIGFWVRNVAEALVIASRGGFPRPAWKPPSIIEAPCGPHSAKPAIFYETIEKMFPDMRRVEMFARGEERKGWDAAGRLKI